VLDSFTYDGGFALQVARQSDEVVAVDLSAEALERVKANAALNGLGNVTTRDANVFDLLHDLDQRGERFDTVILDPPAFAKSKDAAPKAARGYKEINLRALKILKPAGASSPAPARTTSTRRTSEAILADAAVDARATVTVVEKRRQARDHRSSSRARDLLPEVLRPAEAGVARGATSRRPRVPGTACP